MTTFSGGSIAGCRFVATYLNTQEEPLSGSVTFTPAPDFLSGAAIPTVYASTPQVATLDVNGKIDITIFASDDPDLSPYNWTYTVTEKLTDADTDYTRTYSVKAPSGSTVNLSEVAPIADYVGTPIVRGPRGTSVNGVGINNNNHLVFTFTDGAQIDAGSVGVPTTLTAGTHNLVGWTFDPALSANVTAPTNGIIYYNRIRLTAGQLVNNVVFYIAGTVNFTAAQVAICDTAGNRLVSGTPTSNSPNQGTFVVPLASTFTAPGGDVLVAFVFSANSGFMPSFARGASNSAANLNLVTPNGRFMSNSQTGTTVPNTTSGFQLSTPAWFVGLSS